MKKITFCIGKAISLVTDNFFYVLYITLPATLLLALLLTYFPVLAFIPFAVLQAVMFRLWDVNERGIEVKCQKFASVYKAAGVKIMHLFMPKMWVKFAKFVGGNFSNVAGLAICDMVLYGVITLMLCCPMFVIHAIRYAEMQSKMSGDAVSLPVSLSFMVGLILFITNYLWAVLMTCVLTPFKEIKSEN